MQQGGYYNTNTGGGSSFAPPTQANQAMYGFGWFNGGGSSSRTNGYNTYGGAPNPYLIPAGNVREIVEEDPAKVHVRKVEGEQLRLLDALFRRHDELSARSHKWNFVNVLVYAGVIANVAILYAKSNWIPDDIKAQLGEHSSRETTTTLFLILGCIMLFLWVLFSIVAKGAAPTFQSALAEELKGEAAAKIASISDLQELIDPTPWVYTSRLLNQIGLWTTVGFLFFQTFFIFFTMTNSVFHHNGESLRRFAGLGTSTALPHNTGSASTRPTGLKLGKDDLVLDFISVGLVLVATVAAVVMIATFQCRDQEEQSKTGVMEDATHQLQNSNQKQQLSVMDQMKYEAILKEKQNAHTGADNCAGASVSAWTFIAIVLTLFGITLYNLYKHEMSIHFFFPIACGFFALFCMLSAISNHVSSDDACAAESKTAMGAQRRRSAVLFMVLALLLLYYMGFFVICFNLYCNIVEKYQDWWANNNNWRNIREEPRFILTRSFAFVFQYLMVLALHAMGVGVEGLAMNTQMHLIDCCRQVSQMLLVAKVEKQEKRQGGGSPSYPPSAGQMGQSNGATIIIQQQPQPNMRNTGYGATYS
ncbi:unnamed protein product [Amoebophrya sp. A25]|nr:unnamed protein product [Amoebophrya sp. A25]|eukprot:GSA25T00019798001.1